MLSVQTDYATQTVSGVRYVFVSSVIALLQVVIYTDTAHVLSKIGINFLTKLKDVHTK